MVHSQFSLSWDSYNSNICKGFSSLQQKGEFVDMTIAADGYYVKVHQILMALASPYLKELISSAPCQHPVLFLNNISHKTLSSLLEYIYTGEVVVPADNLKSFAEAAKSLHIKGLENVSGSEMSVKMVDNLPQMEGDDICHVSGIKRLGVPISEKMEQISLPAAAKKVFIKQESSSMTAVPTRKYEEMNVEDDGLREDSQDFEAIDDVIQSDETVPNDSLIDNTNALDKVQTNLQFTVSIRGSLQIILNRYIYNLHSHTLRSGVKRWRCVDYRNHRCMAFVITKGHVVMSRGNLHNHSYHDQKILAKIEKKSVFSALESVQGYKEKEEAKESENDEFMILEAQLNDIGDKSTEFIKES